MHKKAKTSTFRCWMKPFWHAQKSKGFLAHRKPLVSLCPENPLSKKVLVKLRPHENELFRILGKTKGFSGKPEISLEFSSSPKIKDFCVFRSE